MIIPTVVQTEGGYWLDVEPVELASLHDLQSLSEAVKRAAARCGPVVPTPSRQSFPKHVVLAYAKARSQKDFEKNTI